MAGNTGTLSVRLVCQTTGMIYHKLGIDRPKNTLYTLAQESKGAHAQMRGPFSFE